MTFLLVDFVRGDVKELSDDEAARMQAAWLARTKIKGGVIYVDCDPPED